jgi:sortase (surface protein transpeptidase)
MIAKRTERLLRYQLRLGFTRELVVTLRRFRTAKHRRSKRVKQLVFQPPLGSFREVAIAVKTRKRHPPQTSLRRQTVLPVGLILLGLGGMLISGLHLQQPLNISLVKTVAAAPAPSASQALPASEPKQLRIPKIEVDTSLIQIGLQANGALDMPAAFDVAGWYNHSPTPGEIGPSVIAGHVDSPNGIAIFWRLRELVPGDTIQIDRADGSTAAFTVTKLEQYPQDSFPTESVYGNIDYVGLRLITCGGTFNTTTGHYSDNIVVYATLQ